MRALHTLIAERSVSPAAMPPDSTRPAGCAQRTRLREWVRDVASNLSSHGMLRRRVARAA